MTKSTRCNFNIGSIRSWKVNVQRNSVFRMTPVFQCQGWWKGTIGVSNLMDLGLFQQWIFQWRHYQMRAQTMMTLLKWTIFKCQNALHPLNNQPQSCCRLYKVILVQMCVSLLICLFFKTYNGYNQSAVTLQNEEQLRRSVKLENIKFGVYCWWWICITVLVRITWSSVQQPLFDNINRHLWVIRNMSMQTGIEATSLWSPKMTRVP